MPVILNLGSVNIDHVYHVERFVAPGETLASTCLIQGAGGKGYNQSIALARAGAHVAHAGCLSHEAGWLRAQLISEHVDVTRLVAVDAPPGHAIIQVVPSGQNAILLHAGSNHALTPDAVPALFAGLSRGDWFLTQNETSCVPEAIRHARQAGLTVCFNPAPMHASVRSYPLAEVDWLFVNESEGEALTGTAEIESILTGLRRLCPRAHLVLTLGAAGVCCLPPPGKGAAILQSSPRVEALDTTAAGDTFIGFFLAACLDGQPLDLALALACRAAAISVTRPGAAASIPFARELILSQPH